jgi:hypothetical protein
LQLRTENDETVPLKEKAPLVHELILIPSTNRLLNGIIQPLEPTTDTIPSPLIAEVLLELVISTSSNDIAYALKMQINKIYMYIYVCIYMYIYMHSQFDHTHTHNKKKKKITHTHNKKKKKKKKKI